MTVDKVVAARPHHGHIKIGGVLHVVHARTFDHMPEETAYQRFNKKLAVWLTAHVGTMTCFWIFNVLSVLSFPATLVLAKVFNAPPGVFWNFVLGYGFIFLIQWVCQNWIQLILLPAIMVGQNLQSQAADVRDAKGFADTEYLVAMNEAMMGKMGLSLPERNGSAPPTEVVAGPETNGSGEVNPAATGTA